MTTNTSTLTYNELKHLVEIISSLTSEGHFGIEEDVDNMLCVTIECYKALVKNDWDNLKYIPDNYDIMEENEQLKWNKVVDIIKTHHTTNVISDFHCLFKCESLRHYDNYVRLIGLWPKSRSDDKMINSKINQKNVKFCCKIDTPTYKTFEYLIDHLKL